MGIMNITFLLKYNDERGIIDVGRGAQTLFVKMHSMSCGMFKSVTNYALRATHIIRYIIYFKITPIITDTRLFYSCIRMRFESS